MRYRPRRNHCESRRGAAAAELAILLPVLAFVMVATIDFGRVYYVTVVLNTCAQNGARYASDPTGQLQSSYKDLTAAALADAADLSPAPTVDVKYSSTASPTPYTSSALISNGYVEVTVTSTFNTILTYPGIPSTVTLTGTARMKMVPAL